MNRVSDDVLEEVANNLKNSPFTRQVYAELRSARKVLKLWDQVNGEDYQEAIDKHNAQFPEEE